MSCWLTLLLTPCPGPPLSDLRRFPAGWVAADQIENWQAHHHALRERQRMHGWSPQFAAWLVETEEAIRYWQLLREAHCNAGFITDREAEVYRRGKLRDLRRLIGDRLYCDGWRPTEIPRPRRVKPLDVREPNAAGWQP